MNAAALPTEGGARSGTTHRPGNRRARRLPVDRLAVDAPPDTADQRQADYFMRVLAQRRRLSDHRIAEYRKAIANSEANGDADAAGGFRRMTLVEEQDRQTVDDLIEKLRRRFPRRVTR